jgi:AraC-like DNA-binding protein
MHNVHMKNKKICQLMEELTHSKNGEHATALPGVRLYRRDAPTERQPVIYTAGLVIICQGSKVGYLHGQALHYDADNYLVMAAPLPLECQTFASKEEPLLVMVVDIDIALLQHIWTQLDQETLTKGLKKATDARVAEATPQTPAMQGVIERLLTHLQQPESAKILGQDLVKELYYYALMGDQAPALFALADRNSHFTRMAQTLSYIQQHLADPLTVEHLAKISGMSSPSFHRLFKKVTGDSPVQFIKKARLSSAKHLIQNHGMKTSIAAQSVGYESASQFSREFKRLFGVAPSQQKAA